MIRSRASRPLASVLVRAAAAVGLVGMLLLVPARTEGVFTASTSSNGGFGADVLDPPTAPSATGGGSVTVSWSATPDTYADGHRVLRSSTPGGPYTQIAEVTPRAVTSHVDSAAPGTHYYVVRAHDGSWESVDSAEVSATVVDVGLVGSWQTGLSHTAGSGSDRVLVFMAGNEEQSSTTPTLAAVTYGGQAMTQVMTEQVTSSSKTALIEVWILDEAGIAAASGTTLSPTWSGGTPDTAMYSHAVFDNVDQVTPTGATATASVAGDTPNPVPIGPVATANLDMVVAAATAGESGYYDPQNGFTVGTNEDTSSGGTAAFGTAYKAADGSAETASMLFVPASPPWINRQIVVAFVLSTVG